MDTVVTLRRTSLFSELGEGDLKRIATLFREETFEKNEYIFMEGDPAGWLYVLKEGKVKIIKHSLSGKETIIEIISPGEAFGGAGILVEEHPASAQSAERTVVLKLLRRDFFMVMKEHNSVAVEMVVTLGRRLNDAISTIRGLAAENARERIARILIKLGERDGSKVGGEVRLNMMLTRQDIADMTGSTVETTIRIMSRMQKEKLIRSTAHRIAILDPQRLQDIADQVSAPTKPPLREAQPHQGD